MKEAVSIFTLRFILVSVAKICKYRSCVVSLLKALTVLLVVSLRLCFYSECPSTVKAQKVLKNSLKEFKGFQRQKRTKLGFLCTLKRRIKYKFSNAGCYGNVTHIKALWCYGGVLKVFLPHHMQKRNRNNLGWW